MSLSPYHAEILEFFAQFVLCLRRVDSAAAVDIVDGVECSRWLERRHPCYPVGTVGTSHHIDGTRATAHRTPLEEVKQYER